MRRIPPAGINLFQLIYILIRDYKEKSGLDPLNLSLGNPDGVPDARVLDVISRFAKDPAYDYHTYAEDKNLNQFCEGMIRSHTGLDVTDFPHLKYVPIAGIKTASALLPLSCGLHLPDASRRTQMHFVSNLPAYDVIGTWTSSYLASHRIVWPLLASENMRLNLQNLKKALEQKGVSQPAMIFVIRPGNPAAVGGKPEEWKELIEFCLERGTRLVNDGAYTALADAHHTPLLHVAKDYPELEWAEMYSLSKSFNDPGARLGAIVGSKDFIEDFILVKGNTDSGPNPAVMAAYGEIFKDRSLTQTVLTDLRALYRKRVDYVIGALKKYGWKQACETNAGFFTLWNAPRRILGREMKDAEDVNRTIITETGIVGVHFTGTKADGSPEPLIRYAVCTDVLSPALQRRFETELARLKPEY
jgi:alanine-synthesizing transaminase